MPFLLGLGPTSVSYVNAPRPSPMDVYNWEQGFFFQDDFRIHPRLTLNLGLRYEVQPPTTDPHDRKLTFVPGARSQVVPAAIPR